MATAAVTDDLKPVKRSGSYGLLPPQMSELRVVLLGNSWSDRSSVGNFILGETKFNPEEEPDCCLTVTGRLKEKDIILINTPDLLHPKVSENKLTEHVRNCARLSDPGPHAFLLVLQPDDFTEEHKLKLCRVLELLSDRPFDHSLVLVSTPREESSAFMENYLQHPTLKDTIRMCKDRHLTQKNLDVSELLTRLGQTVKEDDGEHVSCDVFEDKDAGLIMTPKSVSEHIKPSLNLVLCGRKGAGKTSAAKAILGELVSNSSECVMNQGEACGRRVSLVELPALYGRPLEAVMEESLRCISLCDPEGVHAFALVLPVGPLTDEDKGELETIQNTFGSRINDFTMILFTVETDHADVKFLKKNKDLQKLCQICGGRSVVLNIKDKQQNPELLDAVENRRADGPSRFTKDVFIKGQMETVMLQNARQIQGEKILKEKEEELKRKGEDLRKKLEEVKTLQRKINEQRGEIEQEKKMRAKQLKDKDECIDKERQERKKEREEEERRRKKQEETLRLDFRRKLEASEQIAKSEKEQREAAERNLEKCRKDSKRDRDAWDKERKDMWKQIRQEDKQNLEEEKTSHRKLQEEYSRKRRKYTYWFFVLSLISLLLLYYAVLR